LAVPVPESPFPGSGHDDDSSLPGGPGFGQGGAAEAMPPGPALAALTGRAVADLGGLDEGGLLGVASAARRLAAHAGYLEVMAVAEFSRRREAQLDASKARGDRVRSRDGEYPAEELGFEMNASARSAAVLIDMAGNVAGRLPATLAGMEAGLIDRDRARAISNATLRLPDDKAAIADKILAEAAAEMRLADLYQKAGRLEARLDPEGVKARKEETKRDRRVELRREMSGAASLGGRELDPAEALSGKASIDAEAVRLRNAGLAGTLDQIRAMILMDRIHQRSTWDRLAPPPPEPDPDGDEDVDSGPGDYDGAPGHDGPYGDGGGQPGDAHGDGDARRDGDGSPGHPDRADADADRDHDVGEDTDDADDADDADDTDEEDEGRPGGFGGGPPPGSPGDRTGRKTPMPALINVIIPAGTLLGTSDAPADVGSWGLMDAGAVRDLIEAASRHPRTRWCYTLTGQDGEAAAHACARGSHPWTPPAASRPGPSRDGPGNQQQDNLAQLAELLRELNATPRPIARGTCEHRQAEDRYIPSRKLKHLIRARTARCCAPGCGAQAITGEIDHTIPYPAGASCECNLSPPCARHHHAKHAPGWKLEQPEPGVMRWTTPSGRVYTTHPTQYEE
jgi:hypothetical protein